MSLQTARTFFSFLALAANAGTIVVFVGIVSGRRSGLRSSILGLVRGYELWLAAIVATTAMLGSLYLSEVANLVPCLLCWYQRIAMYPLAVILLIAAVRRDHGIRLYAGALAVVGATISAYHRLIQAYPNLDGGSCAATGPPCSAAYFKVFGFITIPYMALSAFLFVIVILWADRINTATIAPSSQEPSTETP